MRASAGNRSVEFRMAVIKFTTQKWSQPCELLLRARLVPGRAGADTQVIAHIPFSQLRQLPGAADLEDAWIRARTGEDGYLAGKDAEAAACDAQSVPVVTATIDPDVIDQMIDLARTAAEASEPASPGAAGAAGTGTAGTGDAATPGTTAAGTADAAVGATAAAGDGTDPASGGSDLAGDAGRDRTRSAALSPQAWRALRYAMARLALDLVSGPSGTAAVLRQGLLGKPWNTPSLPLDTGWSDTIPASIRRAVLLRDRTCAWPRCRRPAAWCDVHHLRHKNDGGETSAGNCALVCQFHHDVCIHRRGWQLILHPDGTTEARSPDGRHILHSHAPPTSRAG
jgi:hypothetical protein